ncbi:MAG: hypothetical protein K1X79_07340 [Oligoflexia bacterium]|nr:hypothetical protein [Oligoflexia bacterium]
MENFLGYKNRRWMWINLALVVLLAILYLFDHPIGGRSGNSWLGWIYGFLAAAGILYLMYFGVRKRSYYSTSGTVQGWLAAHVWLGVALAIIVPLHCAFSFGINVHTLAYVLMLVVILSGVYGAVCYVGLAPALRVHRGGGTFKEILNTLRQVEREVLATASAGGEGVKQLLAVADFPFEPDVWSCRRGKLVPEPNRAREAEILAKLSEQEQKAGLQLLAHLAKKRQLAIQLQADVAAVSRLQLWLYVHLPVSFALLAALATHILVVFLYR